MSDPTTYQIVDYDGQESVFVPGNKALVPDSRLQDIADAWSDDLEGLRRDMDWPELTDLLDALTQEDNEPHTCQHREADGAECGHPVLGNNLCTFGHSQ